VTIKRNTTRVATYPEPAPGTPRYVGDGPGDVGAQRLPVFEVIKGPGLGWVKGLVDLVYVNIIVVVDVALS
jgi:hypothetical protein